MIYVGSLVFGAHGRITKYEIDSGAITEVCQFSATNSPNNLALFQDSLLYTDVEGGLFKVARDGLTPPTPVGTGLGDCNEFHSLLVINGT